MRQPKSYSIFWKVVTISILAILSVAGGTVYGGAGHGRPSNLAGQGSTIEPDWVEIVEIGGKEYEKVYMTPDKLVEKFGKSLSLRGKHSRGNAEALKAYRERKVAS